MKLTHNFSFLLLLLLVHMSSKHILASKDSSSYVVYFGAHSHVGEITEDAMDRVKETHYDFLGSFTGSRERATDAIFYSYTKHINGFAAHLDHDLAYEISKHPEVVSVFPNKALKLHTTRSWDFLGLEHNSYVPSSSIWRKARFGEDTIIANLDTGVWPESKSFRDEGLGPIPSRWKGICQNQKDATFHCNRKLIGARYFNKGYAAAVGHLNSSFDSPRDLDGHGSHTLSTAAGDFVPGVSIFGQGNGTAKGGSPRARVAAYKVCWPPVKGNECYDADVLAAFDAAIHDGADVISVSLGGEPTSFFNDSVAIGSFHAAKKRIVVVCSAGNSGPADSTVSNVAPWQITVGASTMDREFASNLVLGNGKHYKGQSLSSTALPHAKFYPIMASVNAKAKNASALDAQLCKLGSLDPIKTKGKILVCLRGQNGRVEKGRAVALGGGIGMVLENTYVTGNDLLADPHVLPATQLTSKDSFAVSRYISQTKKPIAHITPSRTDLGLKPAPVMASFSSKGPSIVAPQILKPDITAPGVSVIAAYTGAVSPTNEQFDPRRLLFNAISGTSMSCPHISGIAGLLKTRYPSWSPAAIRSAIMTTATIMDDIPGPIQNATNMKATPFSFGAGHVQPNLAVNPGLVYDLGIKDYLNFLCSLGYNASQISVFSGNNFTCSSPKISLVNLNYPSITVPNLTSSKVTVSRTVKNVGRPSMYTVKVNNPQGVYVAVKPTSLNFTKVGEQKTFKVILVKSKGNVAKGYVFGELVWSDKKHRVRSPIVVKL
ncbi:Subtilisin-like serine endopeptidase family protein [Arabidopsis thaliana]|jgi:subtilisin family serine protease|uniref:Subtilisin-like protease SBT5.3 n=1 Tax=Arabidopsis thaliana TaxID=3702 RepID=AIR3_ARATH|nr:Subtilisin-like serine endopeptidase family protein [Arabidopsis thaliana]Q9ZSP5.1 RecName: Full=Subtilisin-like protease SBT5.3; AltName: Full=Auxin-induced in root cultures protein 3; AltName: Full=Subtilase subfamily 5 member 3; Short=AtSBT5.3; AltName: Full=Subtilisin-like protease AIR3; Flags: Precursor [Arabidopsis thaliana]AAD12260.1 subtilisin-like protease [Arabidopsis thaliana]AEC05801.1 Subtilisin-like serine endopeptidase family protein [Arabidopsis thaliana]|eukprot:NP_565309.2 Subtilisin-like serine endopeptidase family protein [Arabidopsis thaliana]